MMRTPSTVVYTPASELKAPMALLRAMGRDLAASRELAWRLFVRDLSAQYRQSLLGITWAFVPPTVTALIFIVLQSRGVVNFGDVGVPYPVYVMVGTMLWQVFADALQAPLKVVTAAKPMLAKINFPREALIASAAYSVLYGLFTKMLIVVAVLLFFRVPIGWGLVAGLGPLFLLVAFGMCVGLFLTPVGMLYSDISTGLPVATQLLFYLTPVVYVPPQAFPFGFLTVANPVSPLLMAARDLITKGTLQNPGLVWLVGGLSLLGVFAALLVYRLALPIFAERTSA